MASFKQFSIDAVNRIVNKFNKLTGSRLTQVEVKLMDKKKKVKYPKLFKRFWLNENEGSALCMIDAEVNDYDKGASVSADVTFKDCTRQCSLEFYYSNEVDYKKRLKKIRKIIEALVAFEAFLIANPPKKRIKKDEEVS